MSTDMTGAVSEPAESDVPELSPEPEQPAIPKTKIAADRHPITRLLKCLIILPPSSKIFLTECVKYSMLPSKIQPPPRHNNVLYFYVLETKSNNIFILKLLTNEKFRI